MGRAAVAETVRVVNSEIAVMLAAKAQKKYHKMHHDAPFMAVDLLGLSRVQTALELQT